MNRAVAYIRKSTFGADETGVERQEGSYDRQRASILDYAKRNSLDINKWYEEPVSGKSIRKRKVFLQMIRDVKSPNKTFEHIIFGEYDRFMRHVKEGMRYEVELDDAGIKLHFTNLRNDGSTADQIYKSVVREMAAEYSRELARKVIQGMYRKARMGSWLGGVAPYGYRTVKESDAKVSLVVSDNQAEMVRKMFDFSLQGWGHKRIAKWLNENGVETSEVARKRNSFRNKNSDGRWSGDVVRYILRNPLYKGEFRWNKRARVDCFDWKIEGQGTIEIGKLRTELNCFRKTSSHDVINENMKYFIDRTKAHDEWVILENAVPSIVSPAVFDKVQERFKSYGSKGWKRRNDYKYLMSSALRCGSCGNSVTGHRYSKIVKKSGNRTFYYYYRCQGDVKKGTHSASNKPMVRQDAIDQVVVEGMKERINRLIDPTEILRLFKDQMANFFDTGSTRLIELDREIACIEKEIDRVIYAYTKFGRPLPEDEISQLKSKKDLLKAEREFLLASDEPKKPFDLDKEIEEFLSKIKDAEKIVENGDAQSRIRVREGFLPRAEVSWYTDRPTRVDLYWRKLPDVCPKGGGGPAPRIHESIKKGTGIKNKNMPN